MRSAMVERVGPDRLRRWFNLSLLTFLADLTLFNAYQVWVAFPRKLVESDFRIWYAAATLARQSGWAHLYDVDAQRRAVEAVWPGSRYLVFANPPPAAWLIEPFTLLPFGAALALWTTLSVALLVALSQAFADEDLWSKAAFAGSVVAFLPTFVMVEAAPLSPVVVGAVAGCAVLLKRGHHTGAGLVLSLVAVKPNLAVLVPVAILAAGYLRTFVAWLAASAAMVLISVLTVGAQGVTSFVSLNVGLFGEAYHLTYSLDVLLGGSGAYAIAAVIVVVLTVVAARLSRGIDPSLPVAAGVVASLLINHHLTPADFTILLVPVWIVMAMSPPLHMRVTAGALWAAGWMSSIGIAWPVAAMELLLLLVLSNPRPRRAA